jgi:hypothetical protein
MPFSVFADADDVPGVVDGHAEVVGGSPAGSGARVVVKCTGAVVASGGQ